MERLNVTELLYNNDRQSFRKNMNQTYQIHTLNATFPKANFSIYQKKMPKNVNTDSFSDNSFEISHLNNNDSIMSSSNGTDTSVAQNTKRFLNVDKFIMQSNKQQYLQPNYLTHENSHRQSEAQSKSSHNVENNENLLKAFEIDESTPITLINNLVHSRTPNNIENQINNINETSSDNKIGSTTNTTPTRPISETPTPISSQNLENSSNADGSPSTKSMQSKSDEIKNNTPTLELSDKNILSNLNESKNSDENKINKQNLNYELVTSAIIENEQSAGDLTDLSILPKPKSIESLNYNVTEVTCDTESPSRSPVPTMEVKPITRDGNLVKRCNSIFESSVRQENDTKSNASTETSSDAASHAASLDEHTEVKTQHTRLVRKSKTAFFNRNQRVSPVKQSMKLNKTEPFPPTLQRFDKPKEAINVAIDQLDSSNWETVMLGLKSLVRIMRHHPDILDANIHMVCIQLTKSVRNLRSQVARNGCEASRELFVVQSKYLETECDDLVSSLLHRTADTNRFLRADATKALESMCDILTPPKVLHLLTTRGANHQNALVRTTSAKLLNRLADRLGCERIYEMHRENRDKLIITAANLLLEGSLETRSYAKSLFRLLSNHSSYNRILLEIIPTKTYRNIEKTLKTIKSS